MSQKDTQVYFIGAGPGDLKLLTLKALDIIQRADVIIYADSLVNPEICSLAKAGCKVCGSASLTLEDVKEIIASSVKEGKTVARVHSGDPSIYGAIIEQMAMLEELDIEYEVVPGVSSLSAAAASLKVEFTVPELAQTLIITRRQGRTTVPERENLKSLASHQASMALFLSAGMIREVAQELIDGGYPEDIPSALIKRASWADEQVCIAPLGKLAQEAEKAGIKEQALILVGKFLEPEIRKKAPRSRLYARDFSHGRRKEK